jgi:hypothetical protein
MKYYRVMLTTEERVQLKALVAAKRCAAKKRMRSQILLAIDEGDQGPALTDGSVVKALGVSRNTVEKVREQAVLEGPLAAIERKPTNRIYERTLDGRGEAHLLTLACSEPPAGRDKWTWQLLADKLVVESVVERISDDTVGRTLKKMRFVLTSTSTG